MRALLALLTLLSPYSQACEYGVKGSCPQGQECVRLDRQKSECRPVFSGELPQVGFPFESSRAVGCDQGAHSPHGNSHSYWNTLYALDLHTSPDPGAGVILAGESGTIIAYSGCKTKNDDCGAGFGNHVKILSGRGFLLHYAHLERVFVKTGDRVQRGQPLGIEGETGSTGRDNRHLHFSVHFDWRTQGFSAWENLGWLPPSIPFRFLVCLTDCAPGCQSVDLDISQLACKRVSGRTPILCGR